MAHPRDEVAAVVADWVAVRQRIEDGLEPDGFGALARFYTDDVVVVDAAWGRIEGLERFSAWLVDSMVGLDGWRFPVQFTAIEGDDVIVKWNQYLPGHRSDGRPFVQSAYSWLIYAGSGKFRYEEDMYNMAHVLEDLTASGWTPTEPMNLPPSAPERDFTPPTR